MKSVKIATVVVVLFLMVQFAVGSESADLESNIQFIINIQSLFN